MPIDPFDAEGNPSNTGTRWKKWLSNFELFIVASNITDDNQKRATLLYSVGRRVQEIHNTFPAVQDPTYKVTVDQLTAHFTPAVNVPYARHMFREAAQCSDESTLQYVTRLRELSKDCAFGNEEDNNIRDQVIDKCSDNTLRIKYLTDTSITLAKILEKSQAYESAMRQSAEFDARNSGNSVNYTNQRVDFKCFKCEKVVT